MRKEKNKWIHHFVFVSTFSPHCHAFCDIFSFALDFDCLKMRRRISTANITKNGISFSESYLRRTFLEHAILQFKWIRLRQIGRSKWFCDCCVDFFLQINTELQLERKLNWVEVAGMVDELTRLLIQCTLHLMRLTRYCSGAADRK